MSNDTDAKRFPAVFDFDAYCLRRPRGEIRPRKKFTVDRTASDNEAVVKEFLSAQVAGVCKAPDGAIRHPYIIPGATYNTLWDWDSYFSGLAIQLSSPEHFRGSILTFLDHVRSDGRPSNGVSSRGASYGSLPLPLHAQWCVAAGAIDGSWDWVRERWPVLMQVHGWYESVCKARRGLFRLSEWKGHGLDNDPVIHTRARNVVGAIHVNCYHYREYRAMALLADRLGLRDEAEKFAERAEALKTAINEYLWDPIDGLHYHADLSDLTPPQKQEVTWELLYKVRSLACLWTLWAGVATIEQARRIVKEHVLNPEEYLSEFGIRTLAKNERIYNNLPMGGPSNWQGPVWGMSTFITAYGLARYGYKDEAIDIASRTIALFAGDLRENGVTHEYYNADTGAPVIKPGYLSWNLLAIRIMDDLRTGIDPSSI